LAARLVANNTALPSWVKLIGPASSNRPKVSCRGWPPSAETAKTWR
jgi:hypothetical protein